MQENDAWFAAASLHKMERAFSGRDKSTERRILAFGLLGAPIPEDRQTAYDRAGQRRHGEPSRGGSVSMLIESGTVARVGKYCHS
jgi:hypothetical protein